MKKIGFRLWVLIIALVLAVLAISPSFKTGVMIKSIDKNSTAFEEGLRQGMVIKEINGKEIKDFQDFSSALLEITYTNFTKIVIKTEEEEFVIFTDKPIDMTIGSVPRTKIKTGLDLSGGARALVKPVNASLSALEISDLISTTSERFNVYGISDITVRSVQDLEGNYFMLVEIAGATPSDLEELVAKQGKFEAKIGNETVFVGGEKDIRSVCRNDASCARIEGCGAVQEGYACRYSFAIYLSEEAAEKHASITSNLGINTTQSGRYLDKQLDLYVDDNIVDSLLISEDLKGRVATEIAVSGSGFGATQETAFESAKESMHKLQTILITGSLPYKLEIVKLDTISPVLGQKFIFYLVLAGIASIVAVSLIVIIRYKKLKYSLAVLLTSFSEVIIILGFAALIKWNLDLASIAGILVTIGTGVDQQIIILDESRIGKVGMSDKIKRAFFIIISAYFTAIASLIPLYWAGAGLLRGFAVTTIIGITSGVLITRPAFIEILKKFEQ